MQSTLPFCPPIRLYYTFHSSARLSPIGVYHFSALDYRSIYTKLIHHTSGFRPGSSLLIVGVWAVRPWEALTCFAEASPGTRVYLGGSQKMGLNTLTVSVPCLLHGLFSAASPRIATSLRCSLPKRLASSGTSGLLTARVRGDCLAVALGAWRPFDLRRLSRSTTAMRIVALTGWRALS